MIINRGDIEYALDNAGVNYNDVNDTYSGRGMYGAKCLSFTIEGKRIQRDLCLFFAELGMSAEDNDVNPDVIVELAKAVETDDMGRDMIVYFPGWTLDD